MYIGSKIDFIGKQFQLIPIRSCTKMPTLPTLCFTGKLDYTDGFYMKTQVFIKL